MPELTKLGKYEIRRELGKGGMGVVYEGFDPVIERIVAIKTILKSSVAKSETQEVFSRFRREARAAGRLTHPKVVSIYEYGEDENMAFIAMEFIQGKELKEYFDCGERYSVQESVSIMLQLLDAIEYSHSRGVIHRDIKPANILITENGQVKVADFGIAKIESSHLTQVGSVLGTPTYMSPEQFKGLAVDRRTDVYSAGVILYQLLTGERPFTGSVITIMHKVLNQEAAPPSSLNREISKALDAVVMKAMAKRMEDRFQTAGEFMEALKLAAETPARLASPMEGADVTLEIPAATLAAASPDTAPPDSTPLQLDIELWKSIRDSLNPADFRRYLTEYPEGEFAELARLRIASLEKSDAQARETDAANKRAQQENKLAEAKAGSRTEAGNLKPRAEKLAEAEIWRKREAEDRARLERKLAEIKAEAAKAKAQEEAKRKVAAAEQARRAKELAGIMSDRSKKLGEVIAKRNAERAAEAEMEAEIRNKLEAKIKRRQEAREQLRREHTAGTEAGRNRETEE